MWFDIKLWFRLNSAAVDRSNPTSSGIEVSKAVSRKGIDERSDLPAACGMENLRCPTRTF